MRYVLVEALADELISNLFTLDIWLKALRQNREIADDRLIDWPSEKLAPTVPSLAADPHNGRLLTSGEHLKVTPLITQYAELTEFLADLETKFLGLLSVFRPARYRDLISSGIPIAAQNTFELLCQLLTNREHYDAGHTQDLAEKAIPFLLEHEEPPMRA